MQIAQKNPKRVTYSVDEAAKMLGISRNMAYQAVAAGKIPSIRIGERRILIPAAALDRMLSGSPTA
jgi:excisionase family DNA binding protein